MSSILYLSYDPETGHEEVTDRESAVQGAEEALDACRDQSPEGWPEDTQAIYAAVLVPIRVVEEEVMADRADFTDEEWENAGYLSEHDRYVNYHLTPANVGLLAIIEERQRQRNKGWTDDHDKEHNGSELARAAICKALIAALGLKEALSIAGHLWPWRGPFGGDLSSNENLLAEAGALLAAELDLRAARRGEK